MTRRNRRDSPGQRTFEDQQRDEARAAKGEAADRAAVAKLNGLAEKERRERLRKRAVAAFEATVLEIFGKRTLSNQPMRMICVKLLEWIANCDDSGLQASYSTMAEGQQFSGSSAKRAIYTLRDARLITVEAVMRWEGRDGRERDQAPNRYRIDWRGVDRRLAGCEDGAFLEEDPGTEATALAGGCGQADQGSGQPDHGAGLPADHGAGLPADHGAGLPADQPLISNHGIKPPPAAPHRSAPRGGRADDRSDRERADARAAAEGEATWEEAERALAMLKLGALRIRRTLRECRKLGYQPAELLRLRDVYLEFHPAVLHSPGALAVRLGEPPGLDPYDHWSIPGGRLRKPPTERPGSRPRSQGVDEFDRRVIALVHDWCEADPDLDRCDATDRAEALVREKFPQLDPRKEAT